MKHSLILASGSFARQEMLHHAGYEFDIIPADIDEEKIASGLGENKNIALVLAKEKAKFISQQDKEKYIIGSDQVLMMNNKIYSKAKNKQEAKERLMEFQGKTHTLHSGVSVFKNNEELFSSIDSASLSMKAMTSDDLDRYCEQAGDVLTSCVGCYALEGLGSRLFDKIDGNYFTILGMPLLPLSNFLDAEGFYL